MAEKSKSLVDSMKDRIKRAGTGKKDIFYLGDGEKARIRFLNDMNDGKPILFHDKYGEFNTPCLKYYNRSCGYCGAEGRHEDNYAWTIYNYEQKKKMLFIYRANNFSPIPNLILMYETHGTLMDRDYVMSRTGKTTDTSYGVASLDKSTFKKSLKPFTKKEIFGILAEAYNVKDEEEDDDLDDEEEEEEEEEELKRKSKKSKNKKKSKFDEDEDDLDDEDDDDEEDEEEEEDEKPKKKSKKSLDKHLKNKKKNKKLDDDELPF